MEKREGYKKTEIGWIPEDWDWSAIGEKCELKTGATPSRKNNEYWDNGTINWLASGEVHKRYIYNVDSQITLTGHQNSNTHILPINTIVIALNGQGKTRGKVAVVKTETACNQSLGAFICQNELFYSFLFFYLENQYQNIRDLTGEGRNGLNLKILRNINIPIPPLPEQKKIASILTTVDDKISSIEHQIQQTEQLKKGLMEKLLTEGIGHTEFKETKIGRIPKGWDVQLIGTLCDLTSGGTPSRKNDEYWCGDIPWVKTGEIQYNTIVSTEETITEKGIKNSAAKLVPQNSILMAMYGQGKTRGKVAILGVEASLNQACLAIICNERINSTFLFQYFSSSYDRIRSLSQEGSQKNLSATLVRNIKVPVPPIEEQKQIATILSAVDDKIEVLNQKKTQYQTLKKGLSQQLLTGQMRVKI